MHILEGTEAQEAKKWFEEAAGMARQSLCLRRKCGSVIVKSGRIIGRGFNAPPQNNPKFRTCLNEYNIPAGFRHDRTCCIHAEQRAIADAREHGEDTREARIYFADVDTDGIIQRANDAKCTICSRTVLDAGIAEFALNADEGVHIYSAQEFNELSYQYKTPRV